MFLFTRKLVLLAATLFAVSALFAQQKISGLVEDEETGEPVSYASVTSEKGSGTVTDSTGKFDFVIHKQSRLKDSLIVSAAGYSSKKIAVRDLLKNNRIKLTQNERILEQVKVFASLKGDHKQFGYYREFHNDTLTWIEKIDSARYRRNNKGNGEIGYIFEMPARSFLVDKVHVKINHNYDTCWLKLHLRNVGISGLDLPGDEVLKKEVVLPVTLKYGLVEFDLKGEPVNIPTNQIYVGFELLRCGCTESTAPSFFFMGSEKGVNFYRENQRAVWERSSQYTIYVRLVTK